MKKNPLKTASVLSFEKKLACSDALMFAGNWNDNDNPQRWSPISVQEKSVRGTISNRLKNASSSDSLKLDADVKKANLQRVDVASLPFDTDTLKVCFTLRVLGNLAIPSVCNNQDYQAVLSSKINHYIQEHQFSILAARYAENIANGRFFWRNRVGAEAIKVQVIRLDDADQAMNFDSDDFNLRTFTQPVGDLNKLAKLIQQGLMGESFIFLKINAFVRLGAGQEVFPSQELALTNDRDNNKSKILYHINNQAAMHSQKIGNALRTIDTWYPDAYELGPIAVEPYGAVTSRGKAYRLPKNGDDFYTLLDGWIIKDKLPILEQQHYVIATLIRGGVFGEAEKEKVE